MTELTHQNAPLVAPLFADAPMTLVQSFLDGCMGRGFVDDPQAPTCAQIAVADFIFTAGDAASPDAAAMVSGPAGAEDSPSVIFVPQNAAWADLITRCHPGRTTAFSRYAFQHEAAFSPARLRQYRDALPDGYRLAFIDEALYHQCLATPLRDLCGQFPTAQDYAARGLGICALLGDDVVGGASSYTVYRGGIEIEVDTLEAHRRKGIATACAAALILACLERGLTPAWDAANPESKALAEKLGYRFSHAYPALEVELT